MKKKNKNKHGKKPLGVTFDHAERTTGKEKRQRAHEEIQNASQTITTEERPKKKKKRSQETEAKPVYEPLECESTVEPPLARNCLEWMLYPVTVKEFFETYWEKRPLVLKRKNPNYYANLFSTEKMLQAVEEKELKYGLHINLAKFDGEKKIRHNLKDSDERATRDEIEGSINAGISCQCMHPQQYDDDVWQLMEKLETEMGCLWGANCYYTPPKAQFAAPHFDDVEVFMLQVEGAKSWRFWATPQDYPTLPKEYSPDFTQKQKSKFKLLYHVDVEQGDLVYLPRGTVHEGQSLEDTHSHHLTVSTYQKYSWGHFLEELLPPALEKAFKTDRRFQEGLPKAFVDYVGTCQPKDASTKSFNENIRKLITALADYVDADVAADNIASEFLLNRLPPRTEDDKIEGGSPENGCEKGIEVRFRNRKNLRCQMDINPESGESQVLFFHPYGNKRKEHMCGAADDPAGVLRLEELFFPALQALFRTNDFIPIADLPIEADDAEALCELLHEVNVLETRGKIQEVGEECPDDTQGPGRAMGA